MTYYLVYGDYGFVPRPADFKPFDTLEAAQAAFSPNRYAVILQLNAPPTANLRMTREIIAKVYDPKNGWYDAPENARPLQPIWKA